MQQRDIKLMAHTILEQGHVENDYIEYKKSAASKDKILKTACAYANNYMNREIGLIFIGVEEVDDKASGEKAIPKRPIVGVKEALIESTENSLKQLLANVHPNIRYHLITDELDGKYYIILAIEPGNAGPYRTSDKAEKDKSIALKAGRYVRIRRDSILPNTTQEFELLKKFANYSFSSNLNETATLDDLSYEYMKEYLVATNAKEDIKNLSKLDMAKSMGLISESEYGGYRAKNFAVLMFADQPDNFIPDAHVEIIREVTNTDKMEAKIFAGPIWIQAKQVSRYFQETIQASYTIREEDKIEHRIVYNWPLTTFEELATNCILHKAYDSPNYIGIYVYHDRITFVNHNRPLPPVTIEALNRNRSFDDRKYLNPELKNMFFALNLIESYGSGIRRAKDALRENQSPELFFLPENDEDDYTMAVVPINKEFVEIRSKEDSTQRTTPRTTPRRLNEEGQKELQKKVFESIQDNDKITRTQLSENLKVSMYAVKKAIAALERNNYISFEGNSKHGRWVILKQLKSEE